MKYKPAAFVVGAAVAAVIAAWMTSRPLPISLPSAAAPVAAVSASDRPAPSAAPPVAPPPVEERPGAVALADVVQTADGEIRFERGGGPAVDLEPRHGFGVWRPSEHKLRVVLTERALSARETASLARSFENGGAVDLAEAHAVLELTFVPTAQAFDRNELDAATLTLTSRAGASAAADVLGSIDWRGSLPSPQTSGAASQSSLVLTAAGRGQARTDSQESWRFTIAAPVMLSR